MNWISMKNPSGMLSLTVVMLANLVIGCSGEKGPEVFVVTGTVTVDGAPLEKAGVAFRPDSSKGNKAGFFPAGVTDDKGKYELETVSKKGAPAGAYKIVVIPYSAPPSGGEVPKAAAIPFNSKYSVEDKTELAFEVKKDSKPQVFDIKLTK